MKTLYVQAVVNQGERDERFDYVLATRDDLMPYVLSMQPRDCADVLRLREIIKSSGETLHRLFDLLAHCTPEERTELAQLVRNCIDSMRNIQ